MTRARIISIVVIIISLVAIVWSLGGGMFSSRGFEFSIEGAMIEGEVPDTTAWGVAELKLDTAEGRFPFTHQLTHNEKRRALAIMGHVVVIYGRDVS
mgnify:CR=1 FL=1